MVKIEARRIAFVTPDAAVAVAFVSGHPGSLWPPGACGIRRRIGSRRQFDVWLPSGVPFPVTVRTQNSAIGDLRANPFPGVAMIHHLRDTHLLRSSVVEVETGCGVLVTLLTAQLVMFVTVEPLAQFAPPLFLTVDSVGSVPVVPPLLWCQLLPARILGNLDPIGLGLYRRPATLTARELLQVGTLFGLVPAADDARDGRRGGIEVESLVLRFRRRLSQPFRCLLERRYALLRCRRHMTSDSAFESKRQPPGVKLNRYSVRANASCPEMFSM